MRIVIITQDDTFYLPRNLDFLLSNLPAEAEVAACIVTKVSPFGKKESFIDKMKRTLSIFGLHFFVKYGLDFVLSKLPFRPTVRSVLKKHCIPEVPIYSSLNSKESLAKIGALKPDLLISIAGNEIFRRHLSISPRKAALIYTQLCCQNTGD